MEQRKYRKKPVVIEAMRADYQSAMDVYRWVEKNTLGSFEPLSRIEGKVPWPKSGITIDPSDGRIVIATLEGGMWVDVGDYVIRGVEGEFYPVKPSIFEKTYEPVEEGPEEDEVSITFANKAALEDHLLRTRVKNLEEVFGMIHKPPSEVVFEDQLRQAKDKER